MNILICPDSFKGTLSALEAAQIIARGLKKANKDIKCKLCPLADGGEGTLEVLKTKLKATKRYLYVHNPLGKKIKTYYLLTSDNIAFIEMAKASGLTLIPSSERNIFRSSTIGTGEMIKDALNKGAKKIIIGIGGSATNECGFGALYALGVRFYSKNGKSLLPIPAELKDIGYIDMTNFDKRVYSTEFIVITDVKNPLLGKKGATFTYALQKGATEKDLASLEEVIKKLSNIIKKYTGVKVDYLPGTGAAGGMGAALVSFCKAKLISGIEFIMEIVGLEKEIQKADIIITGEGKIDYQTAYGKLITGILKKAKTYNVPVIALGGILGENYQKLYKIGINSLFSTISYRNPNIPIEKDAKRTLKELAFNLGKILTIQWK